MRDLENENNKLRDVIQRLEREGEKPDKKN